MARPELPLAKSRFWMISPAPSRLGGSSSAEPELVLKNADSPTAPLLSGEPSAKLSSTMTWAPAEEAATMVAVTKAAVV